MIEAVGWQYFDTFFRRCSALLTPDGAMLLQAITIDDRAYEVEKAAKQLHQHAHLPRRLPALAGGDLALGRARHRPARRSTSRTSPRTTPRRCAAGASTSSPPPSGSRALGYDERFRRMWELYLAYCEGGFRERRIQDVQLLLAKPQFR